MIYIGGYFILFYNCSVAAVSILFFVMFYFVLRYCRFVNDELEKVFALIDRYILYIITCIADTPISSGANIFSILNYI